MSKFVKKPIPIEARQITDANAYELTAWSKAEAVRRPDGSLSGMMVYTLEGAMTGAIGDYLIQGVYGEFYFCRQDIFEDTYVPVSENANTIPYLDVISTHDLDDGGALVQFDTNQETIKLFAAIGLRKVLTDAANRELDGIVNANNEIDDDVGC